MAPTLPSKIAEPAPARHALLIVWRIVDGKPGHDHQSLGLINALSRLAKTVRHDIPANRLRFGLLNYLLGKYPPGTGLGNPDLIIGAGHKTHLSVLCAQRACGGRSVIMMKPSFPLAWFDFCLIPEHDGISISDNCIQTKGAINMVTPSNRHDPRQGLIMIGGPSRHYDWDHGALLNQIRKILARSAEIQWKIADSRRTPTATSRILEDIDGAEFFSWRQTGPDWVPEQLAAAGQVWVTADSISMLYEALTAGAATGVLSVPVRRDNKISRSIQALINKGLVTSFADWQAGNDLRLPEESFNEADRCARLLLAVTGQITT